MIEIEAEPAGPDGASEPEKPVKVWTDVPLSPDFDEKLDAKMTEDEKTLAHLGNAMRMLGEAEDDIKDSEIVVMKLPARKEGDLEPF